MSVEISFAGTDELLLKVVLAKAPDITAAVMARMDALDAQTVGNIVSKHLAGPTGATTLQQRSGKLAGSVRQHPARLEGDSVIGEVEGAGGTAWYGRLHQDGGTFNVTRKRKGRDSKTGRFRSPISEYSVTFPKRPWMTTGFEEMQGKILAGIEDAISKELSK